jgi:hypothetical protein
MVIDERRLWWLAVLEQAVVYLTNANEKYFTQLWFDSDNHDPCSFCWICERLSTSIRHGFGAGCLR